MTVFFDRYGLAIEPKENDIVRPRKSIHLAFYKDNSFLLVYPPHADKSAELPGGGIEKGETMFEAASREVMEEIGLSMPVASVNYATDDSNVFKQKINFYAEDVKEFWHYDMTFWLIKVPEAAKDWGKETSWYNKGGEYVSWVRRSALPTASMQFFHKNALMCFLSLTK